MLKYALTVALNYEQVKNHPERTSKIKPFIDQYNWKEIVFPSHKKDCKKFESNNKSIPLSISYVPYNNEEKRHTYKSKYNKEHRNQVILLMIPDDKKWHYPGKTLSPLFIGITSKRKGDFCCLNCLHSYRTENKL